MLPAPLPDLDGLDPEALKALLIAKHNESVEKVHIDHDRVCASILVLLKFCSDPRIDSNAQRYSDGRYWGSDPKRSSHGNAKQPKGYLTHHMTLLCAPPAEPPTLEATQ